MSTRFKLLKTVAVTQGPTARILYVTENSLQCTVDILTNN